MSTAAVDPNQEAPSSGQETNYDQYKQVSGTGPSSPGGGGAPGQPAPTSSGRFQNLQGYLKANATNYVGDRINNDLSKQEGQLEQGVQQDAKRYQDQAQQAANPYQQDNLKQFAQQAYTDPAKFANDQDKLKQWQDYYQGKYVAPKAYDADYTLNQQKNQFQDTASQVQSEQGRAQLLQNFYGNPGYNVGQQTLDQFLLQSQPGQLPKLLDDSKELVKKADDAYTNGGKQVADTLKTLQDTAQSGSQYLQSGLADTISKNQNEINQRVDGLKNQRQSEFQNILNKLNSRNIDPTVSQVLGMQLPATLYGIDPSTYLENHANQVGVGNVVTPEDQAKFQALAQLSGQAQSPLSSWATPISQSNPAAQFKQTEFNNDLKNKEAAYNGEYQKLLSQYGLDRKFQDISPEVANRMRELNSRYGLDPETGINQNGLRPGRTTRL